MARNDFTRRPFHLGALVGVRSFNVDPVFHTLRGPVFPVTFKPGENVAECRAFEKEWAQRLQGKEEKWGTVSNRPGPDLSLGRIYFEVVTQRGTPAAPRRDMPPNAKLAMERFLAHYSATAAGDLGVDPRTLVIKPQYDGVDPGEPVLLQEYVAPVPESEYEAARAEHVGSLDCTCGYYAYFDLGHNSHHNEQTNILGLIEGYGVVTVGDRGFRAAKARLLALIDPQPDLPTDSPFAIEKRILRPGIIDRYQVPVFSSLDKALLEYPLQQPDDIDLPSEEA